MKALRIIIFAKAPIAGKVKTRLIPAIGADAAARLARDMLQTTLTAALNADIGEVELCADPSPDHTDWCLVDLPDGITLSTQGDGNLGERMARAAKLGTDDGKWVILVGTDCLEMSADLLRSAASALYTHDAVIFPVVDGGYALLGMKRFDASMFDDIAWSTDQVTAITLERIEKLGWHLHVGATLHDIDEPDDLARLTDTTLRSC